MRRNAVMRVGDLPNGRKPLVKAQTGVLEDRPHLERELLTAALALENLARGDERRTDLTAVRAHQLATVPAKVLYELEAPFLVREVSDGLNERLRRIHLLYGNALGTGCDKYISFNLRGVSELLL